MPRPPSTPTARAFPDDADSLNDGHPFSEDRTWHGELEGDEGRGFCRRPAVPTAKDPLELRDVLAPPSSSRGVWLSSTGEADGAPATPREGEESVPSDTPTLLGLRRGPGLGEKIVFGMACSLGFNALMVTNGTLLDYYETDLKLSSSFLSVTDFGVGVAAVYALLAFGHLSDSTISSFGRRKPYVWALTPILVIALALLYSPKAFPTVELWFGANYLLMQCSMYGLTVVISAWGNALTNHADERQSLYTVDAMADILGYYVGVVLTSTCKESTGAIILACVILIQNYLLVKYVPDEAAAARGSAAVIRVPFIPGLNLSLRNHQLVALLLATVFGSIVGTTVNLLPLFFEFVMKVPKAKVERTYSQYVNTVTGCALLSIFLASHLNRRYGKIQVVRLGLLSGVTYGLLALVTSYGHVAHFFLTSIPAGLFGGIIMVNGNVLLADAIDYDELMTGFRRQSMCQCWMYAPLTFFSVAGTSIPLSIMTMEGSQNLVDQHSDRVVMILRLWVSLVVSLSLSVAYYFMRRYALTEAVQEQVASQLHRRESGEVFCPTDPLLQLSKPAPIPVDDAVAQTGMDSEGEIPSPCAYQYEGSFLDLYFSERELALIASKDGRGAMYILHLGNMVGSLLYAGLLVWRMASCFHQGAIIKGEVLTCLLVLISILLLYEMGRHRAMYQLYTMAERDLMKWAKRKLTARGAPLRRLRRPRDVIMEAGGAHTCMVALIIGGVVAEATGRW